MYFSSGVGCKKDGKILYMGHVGSDVSVEQGQEAAGQCILNLVSNMEEELGDLNRVKKILKMTGFVNSADEFGDQPIVMDYASSLLIKIFGEATGSCSRSAIGVNTLPGNQAIEIEIVFEVKER
jgi:enamine deaminase RidA (YjgF/YER057c/UK114 family)